MTRAEQNAGEAEVQAIGEVTESPRCKTSDVVEGDSADGRVI